MSRGVVLIAHNNEKIDYFSMAVHTAKRVAKYLDLPVTIVTDYSSFYETSGVFDSVLYTVPNDTNYRKDAKWINKGRHRVYQMSPYDETLLIDTDYLINSRKLLDTFNIESDFVCHNNVRWLLDGHHQEWLHKSNVPSLWATVVKFNKTKKAEQIFDFMKIIETNYEHYSQIYKFIPHMYRNDYALTIALKTINGHMPPAEHYFPWNLVHVSNTVKVYRDSDTAYTLISNDNKTGKSWYLKIKDFDFHMLGKTNFLELHQ
jgi:hypothetical protein